MFIEWLLVLLLHTMVGGVLHRGDLLFKRYCAQIQLLDYRYVQRRHPLMGMIAPLGMYIVCLYMGG